MIPTPFGDLLTQLGEVATKVFGWIPDIAGMYETEPVLLLGIGFFVVGGVIGIFGRLLGRA